MRIGDTVRIFDFGKEYTTYDEWMDKYAPMFMNRYLQRRGTRVTKCNDCGHIWKDKGENIRRKCPWCLSYNSIFVIQDVEGSLRKNPIGEILMKAPHTTDEETILYLLDVEGEIILIGGDGIEPVKTRTGQFSKCELRTGMVVKTRNGKNFTVIKDVISFESWIGDGDAILYNREEGSLPLSEFTMDLRNKERDHWDIVEIRKLNSIDEILRTSDYDNLEVLWKRKEFVRYIKGLTFGSEIELTWASFDVKCAVGDIVEVEVFPHNKRRVVKVSEVYYAEKTDTFKRVVKKIDR